MMFTQARRNSDSMIAQAGDFLRLGLRYGEASTARIRRAVQDAAHRSVRIAEVGGIEALDRQLGLLAASTYRLLDPRYRTQLYERVQLSYPLDRDESELPTDVELDLLTVPDSAIATAALSFQSPDVLEDDLDLSTLDDARELVRFLRTTEPPTGKKRTKKSFAKRVRQSIRGWLRRRAG